MKAFAPEEGRVLNRSGGTFGRQAPGMELGADASLMGKSSDIQTVGLLFPYLRSAEVQKQKEGGFF